MEREARRLACCRRRSKSSGDDLPGEGSFGGDRVGFEGVGCETEREDLAFGDGVATAGAALKGFGEDLSGDLKGLESAADEVSRRRRFGGGGGAGMAGNGT